MKQHRTIAIGISIPCAIVRAVAKCVWMSSIKLNDGAIGPILETVRFRLINNDVASIIIVSVVMADVVHK